MRTDRQRRAHARNWTHFQVKGAHGNLSQLLNAYDIEDEDREQLRIAVDALGRLIERWKLERDIQEAIKGIKDAFDLTREDVERAAKQPLFGE